MVERFQAAKRVTLRRLSGNDWEVQIYQHAFELI